MSFRKYGGTQFSSSHNIVKSNVNTTSSLYVTKNVGQPNTYINFESDISGNVNIYGDLDVSGNLSVSGDIDCSGNVNIAGDVDINGNLHVQENIDCSGNIDVSGNVTAEYMFLSSGTNYTTAANGVVPKSYVDSVANGLTPLASCDLCSNVGVISLSGTQTIDGFVATVGMRVLVNAQGTTPTTPAINNGIYIVSSGSWTRATDLTTGDEATGTATLILQGTTYSNYSFVCTTGTNTSPVYIGSPVLWSPFEIPFSLGQGLNKSNVNGNTVVSVDSSLNFINFLDNTAGPNVNTMNIGTNTQNINIGGAASTVAVNGTITINGTTFFTSLLTANAGISTTTLSASGLITANAGISTTTLTASGLITANNGLTVNNAQITANAGITTNTLSVSGNSGTLLTLQNNLTPYNGGQSNILFDGGYELGSITTQDIAVAFGAYQSQMVFNVNWNVNLIPGMSITAYNNNSCVGINNPTFNGSYALNVNGTGNFSGMITAQTAPNPGDNSSNVPTTSWVNTAISGIGGSQWTTSGSNIYYNSGTVGIATATPNTSYSLDVTGGSIGAYNITAYSSIISTNGNMSAYNITANNQITAASFDATSDYRIKDNVTPLDETFTVDNLRPVTYNNTKSGKQDIGLIAHELQEVYPFLVNGEKDGEEMQSVNYTGLIGILIKEIQDLKKEVKMLKEKLE